MKISEIEKEVVSAQRAFSAKHANAMLQFHNDLEHRVRETAAGMKFTDQVKIKEAIRHHRAWDSYPLLQKWFSDTETEMSTVERDERKRIKSEIVAKYGMSIKQYEEALWAAEEK